MGYCVNAEGKREFLHDSVAGKAKHMYGFYVAMGIYCAWLSCLILIQGTWGDISPLIQIGILLCNASAFLMIVYIILKLTLDSVHWRIRTKESVFLSKDLLIYKYSVFGKEHCTAVWIKSINRVLYDEYAELLYVYALKGLGPCSVNGMRQSACAQSEGIIVIPNYFGGSLRSELQSLGF